jgi:hypothetical protein
MEYNLNKLTIDTDGGDEKLVNHNSKLEKVTFEKAEAFFKDIEQNLIEKINEHANGFIFGSIAWLTSEKIINALAKCKNVQILIQKEDFLRPDLGDTADKIERSRKFRNLYSKLIFQHDKFDCDYPIRELSVGGDPDIDAVRCVGNYNSHKKTMPRAHNKFLVFCEKIKESSDKTRNSVTGESIYKPIAVWTGSFNFTINAENSLENVIYLEDKSGNNPIITAYLKEHHQIFALSEPLDWTQNWSAPEFRIGT